MASIYREMILDAGAAEVWDALRDFGALHERLAPGFVVDTRLEPGARVVTFFNGAVVRELLVTCDDERRRLVWSAAGGLTSHYNAAAQVFDEPGGGTRFVWTVDLLPDGVAPNIGAQMDHGVQAIQKAFGSTSPSSL